MDNMLDTIVVGTTPMIYALFLVPPELDISSAVPTVKMVGDDGQVLAIGTITGISSVIGVEQQVKVNATLPIPDTIEAGSKGTKYIIKWDLVVGNINYVFSEIFLVLPKISGEEGAISAVELANKPVTINAVLPVDGVMTVDIYKENTVILTDTVADNGSTYAGYNYSYTLNRNLEPSLNPYTVVWSSTAVETATLWIITPAMLSALKELSLFLNRLNRKARLDELEFTSTDLMQFLKSGADKFNASGYYTNFTMTNAQGSIRSYWLACSQVMALRTRYLEEGESAFDFSGQAISLSVDITQYIESQASNIESWCQEHILSFKRQLHKRGLNGGDGSDVSFRARNRGVAGLTTGPASAVGRINGFFQQY